MSYDVTQDAQYVAAKGAYDQQITNTQQVEDLYKEYNDAKQKLATLDQSDPEYVAALGTFNDDGPLLDAMDPDGSIRKQIDAGRDPVADLKQTETGELGKLATFLIDQNDIDHANDAARNAFNSGHVTDKEDLFSRVMTVLASMSDAASGVADSYMNLINGNISSIKALNDAVAKLRSQRPTGDPTTKATLDPTTVSTLKALGVTIPDDVQPDPKTGVIKITQADFDTMINNAQSSASDLTTVNQQHQVEMSKAVNIVQAMQQGQVSELDKLAQLFQKLYS